MSAKMCAESHFFSLRPDFWGSLVLSREENTVRVREMYFSQSKYIAQKMYEGKSNCW